MKRAPGWEGVHGYRSAGRREMDKWLRRRRLIPLSIIDLGTAIQAMVFRTQPGYMP